MLPIIERLRNISELVVGMNEVHECVTKLNRQIFMTSHHGTLVYETEVIAKGQYIVGVGQLQKRLDTFTLKISQMKRTNLSTQMLALEQVAKSSV